MLQVNKVPPGISFIVSIGSWGGFRLDFGHAPEQWRFVLGFVSLIILMYDFDQACGDAVE